MERKCSVCGSPLKRDNMYYKCTFCAYFEPIDAKQDTNSAQQVSPQPGMVRNGQGFQETQSVSSVTGKKKIPVAAIVAGIVLLLAVVCVLPFLLFSFVAKNAIDSYDERMEQVFVDEDEEGQDDRKTNTVKEAVSFQSPVMEMAVMQMFQKPLREITEEDLESIQYLDVSVSWMEGDCTISYSTQDYRDYALDSYEKIGDDPDELLFAYGEEFLDTIQTVSVPYTVNDDESPIYEDLEFFANIKALRLRHYYEIDLSAFPNLKMLDCSSSGLSEVLEAGALADQIEVLSLDDSDLAGIEKFTSLKKLYLSRYDTMELGPIANCTSLETLYLVYLDGSRSLACLEPLTNLKTLYIDAYYDEGVKDLSAIASFTELENLAIARTNILHVDFLKDLKKLKSLRISGNDRLKDFEGLSGLEELEYLQFDIGSLNGNQPEYEGLATLKNVKYLYLNTVYNLDFLYELNQLEELEINITFYNYLLEPIRHMSKLKSLSLISCHSQYEDGFACLSELPELKKLTVEDMEFKDPADGLFALENLEELRIRSCNFAQAPAQVIVGDNLKVLDLSYSEFINGDGWQLYYRSAYGDPETARNVLQNYYSATSLEELYVDSFLMGDVSGIGNLSNLRVLSLQRCELTEIAESELAGCPKLEEVYLSDNEISDISFVKNLPNLVSIYLEDCYVTDLTPLKDCTKLKYVDVRNNPIDGNPLVDVTVREE